MRELSSCCRLGGSSARLQLLKRLEGRPCRALSLSSYGLPRVWSPLQGYAPWALKRIAPIGAYLASRSQQSEEYNLQYKGATCRASAYQGTTLPSTGTAVFPPKVLQYVLPRHRSSVHGHCGISSQDAAVCAPKAPQFCSRALRYFLSRYCSMCSQGTAVCAPKAPRFCSRVLRYFLPRCCSLCSRHRSSAHGYCGIPLKVLQSVLPRHRSSAHRYCGISSRGPAVCAPKGAWYGPQGASVPLTG